jgi:hypothetical protein
MFGRNVGARLPAIAVGQSPAMFQNRRHRGQPHSYKVLCLPWILVFTQITCEAVCQSPMRPLDDGESPTGIAIIPMIQRGNDQRIASRALTDRHVPTPQ